MIIKSVTPHPKHKSQYVIRLEDGETLTVYEGALTQFYIYPGKDLSTEVKEALLAADREQGLRSRAMDILDRRAMSRKELIDKLVQKGEDRDQAEQAADWLVQIGQINEEEYAGAIVRHYGAKGYGRKRIEQELWRRGVEKEAWDQAFTEMPEDTDETIDRFIESKLRGEIPDRKEEKRVTDALMRRGYSWDEIRSAMRRHVESVEENN